MVVVSAVSPIAVSMTCWMSADADRVTSRGGPVDLDVEVLAARHLLGIDVAGARHLPNNIRHVARDLFEHCEVRPENLHTDFGSHSGGQHVDPVDDRHGPDIRHARHLRRPAHLGPEPIERHACTPLVMWLQVDDGFRHVQRRGVGGGICPRYFRDGILHFRKRHQRRVLLRGDLRVLLERNARVGDRHEHQIAFVQRRHELAADASGQKQRAHEQEGGSGDRHETMGQGAFENRPVDAAQQAHHRVGVL